MSPQTITAYMQQRETLIERLKELTPQQDGYGSSLESIKTEIARIDTIIQLNDK